LKWRILVDSEALIYLFFFTTKLNQQHCKNIPAAWNAWRLTMDVMKTSKQRFQFRKIAAVGRQSTCQVAGKGGF